MSLAEIERRLRVLEDVEEIKKLKARYCAYAEHHLDSEGVGSLFVEDGVWDGGPGRSRHRGPSAIRDFFVRAAQLMPFALHFLADPIIEVDGEEAHGTWHLFLSGTFSEGNRAFWTAGRYEDDYVRVDGTWKYRELRVERHFTTPYDEGWAKQRFV